MKNRIIAILFLGLYLFNVKATFKSEFSSSDDSYVPKEYEYVPIVREGVVLEYVDGNKNISYITFSGTAILDEKEYYKCYFCNSGGLIKDDELFAYIREENKRVYVYPDKNEWAYSHGYWFDEEFCESEILVYDFNLKKGDIFKYCYDELIISDIDYILINDKLRKRYKFISNGSLNTSQGDCIIEGIGMVSPHSYLPYPLPDRPTGWHEELRVLFNAEYNDKGEKVYQSPYPEYDAKYEYVPLVREGVIWTYKYQETMYYEYDYCHITFSGEEEIAGKIYKKCWQWNDDCSFNSDTANLIAYMREENGKIYTYLKEQRYDLYPYIEHVSYDFNLGEIGYYAVKINFIGYEIIDGTLRKKWEIYDNDFDWWNGCVFIEGIGLVGEATEILPFPLSPIPLNGSDQPRLTLQTTMSGDIIFDAGNNDTNPCLYGYDYNPLVHEGKEWVYVNRNSTPEDILRLTLYGYTEIEGKTYLNCWQYSDCEFNVETSTIIAYLREENRKVYARYPNNAYEIDMEKEYCLYDFNIMHGEKYIGPFGDENYEYQKVQNTYYHYGDNLAAVSTLLGNATCPYSKLLMYERIGFEEFLLPFPFTFKESDWKLLYIKENGEIMNETYWNSEYEDPCLLPGNVNLVYDDFDKIKLEYWYDNIVVSSEGDLTVGVYTFDGVKVLESTGSGNVQLSTAELPIGIYIVNASVGTTEKSQKIVVK